ncbi:MAG: hypothetical protein IJ328_05085 [Muribaculaceae bacterium]|nr:hypothetical protein [Muribaculaceae bacterium]
MTVSKTQRIGAKESAEAKVKRRYEELRYICNHNRFTSIAIQSVTATKTVVQSQESK